MATYFFNKIVQTSSPPSHFENDGPYESLRKVNKSKIYGTYMLHNFKSFSCGFNHC